MNLYRTNQLVLEMNQYGRPYNGLTDKVWQEEFNICKAVIKPSKNKKMCGMYSTISNDPDQETNYARYCSFINNTLKEIRKGNYDYCFFGYQIWDLLKYEYNNLRTRYLEKEKCWEVWLDA